MSAYLTYWKSMLMGPFTSKWANMPVLQLALTEILPRLDNDSGCDLKCAIVKRRMMQLATMELCVMPSRSASIVCPLSLCSAMTKPKQPSPPSESRCGNSELQCIVTSGKAGCLSEHFQYLLQHFWRSADTQCFARFLLSLAKYYSHPKGLVSMAWWPRGFNWGWGISWPVGSTDGIYSLPCGPM